MEAQNWERVNTPGISILQGCRFSFAPFVYCDLCDKCDSSKRTQECLADARKALPARALAATAAGRAAGRGEGDRPLTVREQKQLLAPLLRLRQACCHPQVRLASVDSYL